MSNDGIVVPRWQHDFDRAKVLARGIQAALEKDAVQMAEKERLSDSTWELIDELHDIAVRYNIMSEDLLDDDD